MTAPSVPVTDRETGRTPSAGLTALLALIPAAIVLGCTAVLHFGAGRPDAFVSVAGYQLLMNLAVLGRFFGLFAAVVVIWGPLRGRNATRGLLALAIVSAPIAYAATAFAAAREFFPVEQALYYAVNPLTVAGIASQCAMAAVGEAGWRWWRQRRSLDAGPPLTWRIVTTALIGWAVLFFTVLFRGGVTYFFYYQQGYLLLFT